MTFSMDQTLILTGDDAKRFNEQMNKPVDKREGKKERDRISEAYKSLSNPQIPNPFQVIFEELTEIKQLLYTLNNTAPAKQVEIIDRKELMKRLNITEPTAIRWGKKGTIPELHIGSNVRYNWPAVVLALEKQK